MANTTKEIVTLRLPRTITEGMRDIATREGETQAAIYRRLLRRGLKQAEIELRNSGDAKTA